MFKQVKTLFIVALLLTVTVVAFGADKKDINSKEQTRIEEIKKQSIELAKQYNDATNKIKQLENLKRQIELKASENNGRITELMSLIESKSEKKDGK